ncbi:MAG: lysoplasmalogenase [Eubacterium sp.]|nr:lysoplasmalogenase [Eubacterium sp.]
MTGIYLFSVLFVIDILVGSWYTVAAHPYVTKKAFWLKMLASGIFVANGVIALTMSEAKAYGKLIVIALVLGMIGDALLSLEPYIKQDAHERRNNIICTVIGAAAFLAGHIIYIIAFVKELHAKGAFDRKVFLIAWAIILATAIVVKTLIRVKLGKLAVPFLIYAMGLSAMGAQSITLALFGFVGHPVMQVVLVTAPLLFMISDSTLALKFADNKRFGKLPLRLVTLITYYAAQMLFGFTITLM